MQEACGFKFRVDNSRSYTIAMVCFCCRIMSISSAASLMGTLVVLKERLKAACYKRKRRATTALDHCPPCCFEFDSMRHG